MFKRKEYIIIFLILVTEVLGFSLILPFMPLYAQKLGASPITVGLILTSFSLFQFVSSPILGKLSDTYGRKPLLLISQFSTFISFIVLGFANSVFLIFLSRIIDGLFGSNMTIAQAYLGDISTKENRSKAFGISGAAFGFGFLVGPAIGGILAKTSFAIPSFIAAGVSLLTMALTVFFLKETVVKDSKRKFSLKEVKLFDLKEFTKTIKLPELSSSFLFLFLYMLAHVTFVSNFALYAERQLSLNVNQIGYLLTYVGFISIFMRGVILSKLIDVFGEIRLTKFGVWALLLGYVGVATVTNAYVFLIVNTLFAFGSGILRPLLLGDISRSSPQERQGAVMGITGSLGSITQIIGPLLGALAINYFVPGSLGVVGVAVLLPTLFLINNLNQKNATI